MLKTKKSYKQQDGKKLLRQLKAKYRMTWPEIGKTLGLKSSRVSELYGNNDTVIPQRYVFLINWFLKDKAVMDAYKAFFDNQL